MDHDLCVRCVAVKGVRGERRERGETVRERERQWLTCQVWGLDAQCRSCAGTPMPAPSPQNTSWKPTKHHTSQHHLSKRHPANQPNITHGDVTPPSLQNTSCNNHTAGLQSTVSTCSKHHNMISRRNDNFTKAHLTLDGPHTPDLIFTVILFSFSSCTVVSQSQRLGFTLFSVCYCLQFCFVFYLSRAIIFL